jgi:tRNA(Ile)-lysidine synthase
VRREYDKLCFEKKDEVPPDDEIKKWKIFRLTSEEFERYEVEAKSKSKLYGAFSGVEEQELCIRTRKQGDVIALAHGNKKLQDFFVDEKVPKINRDKWPILAKGSDVLWVLPSTLAEENSKLSPKGRFSSKYKVIRESKKYIIVVERL